MSKRYMLVAAAGFLALSFSATSAFAFHCPKLIGAGQRLAAKASGPDKDKAVSLLDEATNLHKSGDHTASMQKGTQAVDLLTK
ncbi:MAG: hypothetical protein O2807_10150 [bacterium]|nr:hypothetical protein [bacterium]